MQSSNQCTFYESTHNKLQVAKDQERQPEMKINVDPQSGKPNST